MSRHSTRQVVVHRPTFAARFDAALAGRTSEDFAREIDVTLRTVQRWRSGEGEPQGAQLAKVAAALGRPVEWFYPDTRRAA